MENLASELNKYFIDEVQLSKNEKKAAYKIAMPIIEQLAKYVNRADPRFGADAVKVGSSFQGLKVSEPNEYDVNIPLQAIEKYGWGNYTPSDTRYYSINKPQRHTAPVNGPPLPKYYDLQPKIGGSFIKADEITIYQTSQGQPVPEGLLNFAPMLSKDPMWLNSDDLTFEGDIIPILLKKHFKRLLKQGISELGLEEKVEVDRRFHGPAITIKIDSRGTEISIDFSVVISKAAATFPDSAGWPHPNTEWPSKQMKDILTNIGVSLVARKDIHWMVSPALAERELMKGIDQPGECRKKSHRIMKKLNEDLWSKRTKAISSYALKNLLFWECESFPHSWQWTSDKLAERIMSMTVKLYTHVTQGELKLFFLPQRNILQKDNEAERIELQFTKDRIEKFLNDPLTSMKRLNEKQ